jgi:hypothetical protein
MQRWMSSTGAIDRGLTGLGVAIAVGSAAFAAGMVFGELSAEPRAFEIAVHRTIPDTGISSEMPEDDRTGSISKSDGDAGAPPPQPAPWITQDRDVPFDPQRHPVSSYVLRYADVDAALVQGPDGTIVVTPGSVVPDAGLIRSIEKRAGRWVVVTSTGTIEEPSMSCGGEP